MPDRPTAALFPRCRVERELGEGRAATVCLADFEIALSELVARMESAPR